MESITVSGLSQRWKESVAIEPPNSIGHREEYCNLISRLLQHIEMANESIGGNTCSRLKSAIQVAHRAETRRLRVSHGKKTPVENVKRGTTWTQAGIEQEASRAMDHENLVINGDARPDEHSSRYRHSLTLRSPLKVPSQAPDAHRRMTLTAKDGRPRNALNHIGTSHALHTESIYRKPICHTQLDSPLEPEVNTSIIAPALELPTKVRKVKHDGLPKSAVNSLVLEYAAQQGRSDYNRSSGPLSQEQRPSTSSWDFLTRNLVMDDSIYRAQDCCCMDERWQPVEEKTLPNSESKSPETLPVKLSPAMSRYLNDPDDEMTEILSTLSPSSWTLPPCQISSVDWGDFTLERSGTSMLLSAESCEHEYNYDDLPAMTDSSACSVAESTLIQ